MLDQDSYSTGVCTAAADLSAKKYTAVKVIAAFTVSSVTVAGEAPYGILQNDPKINESATVRRIGITHAKAGAAVAAGAKIAVAADGRLITAVTGNTIIGTALSAAGAANVIFALDLLGQGATAP